MSKICPKCKSEDGYEFYALVRTYFVGKWSIGYYESNRDPKWPKTPKTVRCLNCKTRIKFEIACGMEENNKN